ncbi:MAG: hypothetical protein MMC33_007350 [Icmadophila ericetorum]|nr:hypothetical protein [Icmadophila ericetorum]
MFQGFTGKQATQNATQSRAWGTNIVGGVRPGKTGEHLGLPVLPTVRAAKEKLRPDATGIYVAAHQAAGAIEEALEAEIPLIVAVAEFIPLHDVLRIHSMLKTQSKSRLVGANSPGIISSIGKCRIGFQPLPCFSPGNVGIVAKSGTLSYEAVASTTRAGVGQSLVIGMGGDMLAGTNFVEALQVFEHDDDTQGIILIGEIGGQSEQEAAEWIKEYRQRVSNPKPIMAMVAGIQAPRGRVMGHAGAFIAPGEDNAQTKIKAFEEAGVTIVHHPSKFGEDMKQLLSSRPRPQTTHESISQQKRGLHTISRRAKPSSSIQSSSVTTRKLHLDRLQSFELLRASSQPISRIINSKNNLNLLVAVTVDRSNRGVCIVVGRRQEGEDPWPHAERYPIDGDGRHVSDKLRNQISKNRHIIGDQASFFQILDRLVKIFFAKEAVTLQIQLTRTNSTKPVENPGKFLITDAVFTIDDSAYRISKRHTDLHEQRQVNKEDAHEVEAERYGIVYVKLKGKGKIGTLVNGAGLAMNTLDALSKLAHPSWEPPIYSRKTNSLKAAKSKAISLEARPPTSCTNFLDMGGRATSDTVKQSFRIVLKDARVKVIFVNIFGGLTLCDMIAEGIILAYRDLGLRVPVVVRLRGSREQEGQRMIAESGLPLHAFDDFGDAALKAIELANTPDPKNAEVNSKTV